MPHLNITFFVVLFFFVLLSSCIPIQDENVLYPWDEFQNEFNSEYFQCNERCKYFYAGRTSVDEKFVQPTYACGQDWQNYEIMLCNNTLSTNLRCFIGAFSKPFTGIQYPGKCGCPSNCYEQIGYGKCVNNECQCTDGHSGVDCYTPSEDSNCVNGHLDTIDNVETCVCDEGYTYNDCSQKKYQMPEIVSTYPSTQYTSYDKYGNEHPVFNTSEIAQMRLTMPNETIWFMQDPVNVHTKEYFEAGMWFYNNAYDKTYDNVGFRIKGGASRKYIKKSFKLSFNKYDKGRKWKQLKKLGLKAMQMDLATVKEILTRNLMYSMNVPVQRMSYTQLFVNDVNFGMYLLLENVDEQFLKSRFNNPDGALYKCTGTLEYLGVNPELYANCTIGAGLPSAKLCYVPETDPAFDYSNFAYFVNILNNSPDSTFVDDIQTIFDIDTFLRTAVAEILTGNWDGLYNGNNYFLYYDPDTSRFVYMRHDLDAAFGWLDNFYNRRNASIFNWGMDPPGRGGWVYDKILSFQPFRDTFAKYMKQAIDSYFHVGLGFNPYVEYAQATHNQLNAGLKDDLWRLTDYGNTYTWWQNSLTHNLNVPTSPDYATKTNITTILTMGIENFMQDRVKYALMDLAEEGYLQN